MIKKKTAYIIILIGLSLLTLLIISTNKKNINKRTNSDIVSLDSTILNIEKAESTSECNITKYF